MHSLVQLFLVRTQVGGLFPQQCLFSGLRLMREGLPWVMLG